MSRLLKLDMHVHTSFSHDGTASPRSVVERAREIGLDGIAITDHNTQKGVREAVEAGRELDVIVIPGVEVSCREGHVLVYGCQELPFHGGQGVSELLEDVERLGLLAAPAHPFDLYRSGMGWKALLFDFHAVETVNAHSPLPRAVVAPLARRLHASELGGSDAHRLRSVGRGLTIVREGGEILEEVRRWSRAVGKFDIFDLLPRLNPFPRLVGRN